MIGNRELLLCFLLNWYFCKKVCLRNCFNFKNFKFVLVKVYIERVVKGKYYYRKYMFK